MKTIESLLLCQTGQVPILNKDMQVCISLASRPTNLGTRFHNYLYDELGLNFIYKAFTTEDLEGAVRGIRALGFRGASISMPFKEQIIPMLDSLEPSAAAIESVNTVVNSDGKLVGSNTDFEAVLQLLGQSEIETSSKVLVRGSGGMAKAVVAAFRQAGFGHLTISARNRETGGKLATKYGYRFDSEALAKPGFDVLVNVTPIGMAGANESELSFSKEMIAAATTVFDVVAFPADTPLILEAKVQGKKTISGAEVIALQAAIQFEKYTGVKITPDQIARASEFSRN
jgi:shikimate dehydrogenase